MPVGACYEFDAFWPASTSTKLIWLPKSTIIKNIHDTGNSSMMGDAVFIPDVVMKPTVIFRGLRRDGQEFALCYCGEASGTFATEYNIPFDAPPRGQVFLVFVTPDMEITKYRFCGSDPDIPGYPIDHHSRFGGPLWPILQTSPNS